MYAQIDLGIVIQGSMAVTPIGLLGYVSPRLKPLDFGLVETVNLYTKWTSGYGNTEEVRVRRS